MTVEEIDHANAEWMRSRWEMVRVVFGAELAREGITVGATYDSTPDDVRAKATEYLLLQVGRAVAV